jgi:hypothetical protein
LEQSFFGLTPKYIEGVYEEMFQLKYYSGFSIFESYNIPIGIRRWFLKRVAKQFQLENEKYEKAKNKSRKR